MNEADRKRLDKLWRTAYSFEKKSDYIEAAKWFRMRVDICQRVFGKDHIESYRAILAVAGPLVKNLQLDEARVLYEQAFSGLSKHCGKNDVFTKTATLGLMQVKLLKKNPVPDGIIQLPSNQEERTALVCDLQKEVFGKVLNQDTISSSASAKSRFRAWLRRLLTH